MKRILGRLVGIAVVAAVTLGVGAAAAQAQGFCYRTPRHQADILGYGPFGPIFVPCIHWVTVCE